MIRIRPVLLASACCVWLGACINGQTVSPAASPAGGAPFFQALVKDARTRIREIGADKLAVLRKTDSTLVLVDVREDNEWNKRRIAGAVHVGRGVLEVGIESKVPQKLTPIVVYCQGGGRAAVAADVLGKMGYTNVSSLAGGLAAYEAAGLPVDSASPAK
jgi:rhodanese-related sulfurtransferase